MLDLTEIDPGTSVLASGAQTVNTRRYQQTLYDSDLDEYDCGNNVVDDINYNLGRKFTKFHAVVGLADNSPSGDTVTFTVLVDGQKKGIAPTLNVGETATVNVDVTGAFRITLEDTCTATLNSYGNYITAVWVNPTVK